MRKGRKISCGGLDARGKEVGDARGGAGGERDVRGGRGRGGGDGAHLVARDASAGGVLGSERANPDDRALDSLFEFGVRRRRARAEQAAHRPLASTRLGAERAEI